MAKCSSTGVYRAVVARVGGLTTVLAQFMGSIGQGALNPSSGKLLSTGRWALGAVSYGTDTLVC